MRHWLCGLALLAAFAAAPVWGAVVFDGVAAGDMTDRDVILWTRAMDNAGAAWVVAEVATDPGFRRVVWSAGGATIPANDFTLKLNPIGLKSGTRYYYRFVADTMSGTGQFRTAPAASQRAAVRFGFSGDADGRFRPYPTIVDIGRQNLDFFVFNGDTMYETASGTASPAVPALTAASTPEQATAALTAYNQKYAENIVGVAPDGGMSRSGQPGLRPLFAATGHYTLLDNHELGNVALQSGGAPPTLLKSRGARDTDVNGTGSFQNQTMPFLTLQKSYFNYHPTRSDIVGAPASGLTVVGPKVEAPEDPRSHGTPRQYFAQGWGRRMLYVQIDDRSYRDARLGDENGRELPGPDARGDNTARTMLGATQLAWLKRTLLAAKASGVTWIFIGISTPIDMVGDPPAGQKQDQKSWYGGYRAERTALLSFIADNAIRHVVFLATDDHMTRLTRLAYGDKKLVPDAFQIVTGPIGAGGPDWMKEHDIGTVLTAIAPRIESQAALGQPLDGLKGLPGLVNVWREMRPEADKKREPVDFISPDTFGYAVLAVDEKGVLTVTVLGIPSYQPNANFAGRADPAHRILSFQVRP